jgi:hypothetical protein
MDTEFHPLKIRVTPHEPGSCFAALWSFVSHQPAYQYQRRLKNCKEEMDSTTLEEQLNVILEMKAQLLTIIIENGCVNETELDF